MNITKIQQQIDEAVKLNALKNDALPELFKSAHDDWVIAGEALERYGSVIDDSKGALKANPAYAQKANAWSRMMRILEQCGLTPKAKKSNAPKTAPIDPTELMPDL